MTASLSNQHRVRDLARACHPGPTVAVTAFSAAMAAGAGAPGATTALIALAVFSGQLSIGWSNDWIDADRDAAVGRAGKPVGAGRLPAVAVRNAALVALTACIALSMALGWRAGVVHLFFVGMGWAYNLGLKGTVWSWVPYALGFGALPLAIALALPGSPAASWWAIGGGALLGVGAHGANVLPDLVDDEATGVRGLPHRIGRTATSLGSAAALIAATVLAVLVPEGSPTVGAMAALAVALGLTAASVTVALKGGRSRVPFAAALAVAGIDVVLLVLSDWVVPR